MWTSELSFSLLCMGLNQMASSWHWAGGQAQGAWHTWFSLALFLPRFFLPSRRGAAGREEGWLRHYKQTAPLPPHLAHLQAHVSIRGRQNASITSSPLSHSPVTTFFLPVMDPLPAGQGTRQTPTAMARTQRYTGTMANGTTPSACAYAAGALNISVGVSFYKLALQRAAGVYFHPTHLLKATSSNHAFHLYLAAICRIPWWA